MTTVTFYKSGDMFDTSVWYGDAVGDSSHITISNGYQTGIYTGSFFYYSDGSLAGGTATGYSYSEGGVLQYAVSGANADALTVQYYLDYGYGESLQAYVLRSNDSINGSAYNDWLRGHDGNDLLLGNAGSDWLDGGNGSDTLIGGQGIDMLIGGLGNDTYVVDNIADVISETSTLAGEIDTVQSSVTWTLGVNLEKLVLTGTAAINGTGNALNNTLTGNAAANILNGGAGIDTLIGGLGNDTYVVDNVADVVSETSTLATEIDSVWSSVNWTLGTNLEKLVLTGSAAINGAGNALGNMLTGNAAANILNGGAGIDTLIGGLGNDTYVVDNIADVVSETSTLATEIDSVWSSANWTLGANLENLVLIGGAAINGTGNNLNNTLYASVGNNVLDGGAGIDTATYSLASSAISTSLATITTQATGGSGSDTLLNVENLTGSNYNDTLTGNAAANVLNGGAGSDTLIGGLDNDTYVVDNAADVVSETSTLATEIDTVQSSVTRTLGANLEKLVLTGSAAINGTGNALNNTLTGNAAANVLNGGAGNDTLSGGADNDLLLGGIGTDTLYGGMGADSFDFNALSEMGLGALRDVVGDFKTSEGDKIDLSTLDANTSTTANDAFSLIGSAAFSGTNAAGQLRFANGVLYGSTDADSAAEFEISLLGVSTLSNVDFIV
ncbi:calcium-binding protein [Pseudomonas sp. 2FE]|uniref:beta strand repeat-containing protein n=1 Tax=Pseudomonas sp. 2FE TaxID=2502190 RepID=UPI0010FA4A32|nr:calcium-binding protein [Pseudomonas sp. 2FE]